jgi:5-methylthioadenosine/S-adenosylhomocysteine deaminase
MPPAPRSAAGSGPPRPLPTTVIRRAAWVVAYDAASGGHVYRRDADVAFTGDRIVHVDAGYAGPADTELDGRALLVLPGLVNVHSHPSSEPGNKGLLEELGSPLLGQSSLYEFMPVFRLPPAAAAAATQVAMAELLQSGVTSIVDLSVARPGWADELAATGIRAWLGPMFRSASWRTPDGRSVVYDWDEAAGRRALALALETIDTARKHPSGRIDGMLCPSQVDTCTPELLQAARDAARERSCRLQIHAAQSVVEFNEITRRYGQTPIEWLDGLGLLGPETIIGHGIFLNDHPWLHWPHADDFARLRASGAGVAHCPTVFARRGIALHWLGRYVEAGIPLGIGTDTFPLNMIDELRMACYAARVLQGDFRAASTAQAFSAATLGGARLLGRDDLGRLAPGAKADLSLVDLAHPAMRPVRDPLRSLVYSASDRPIRTVYVDGQAVVQDGRAVHIDVEAALQTLAAGQAQALANAPRNDWAGRSAEQMSPLVFEVK